MARVLITGSTTGLGKAAAEELLADGHEVVLHARDATRSADIASLAARATGTVVGDLSAAAGTRRVADEANRIGGIDAVIHNAGVYAESVRNGTPEGHARTLAVNTLAPYLLTAWINGPSRLVYLSSGMHRSGDPSLRDLTWDFIGTGTGLLVCWLVDRYVF